MTVMIKKASGKFEEFNPMKVRKAILRSGASEELVSKILKELDSELYEGISTRKIFGIVHRLLHKERPALASRYDLKGAIMRLGPDGFTFETYIGEVLREYDYKTQLRQFIKGACVKHEIDVVAENPDGKRSAIECKYHNVKGMRTGLKVAMYTCARLTDMNEGCVQGSCPHFDDIWLVTNTRFSSKAIKYAQCRKMKLLGWRYPAGNTLEKRIESKGLYPVTILKSLDTKSKQKLFKAGTILAKDLLSNNFNYLIDKTDIKEDKLKEIITEAEHFYKG